MHPFVVHPGEWWEDWWGRSPFGLPGFLLDLFHITVSGIIGRGGNLAVPPLPHHRTYGSRIRRSGRAIQRGKCPLTGRSSRRAITPVSSLTLSGSDSRLTDALPGFFTARTFLSFHPLAGNRSGLRRSHLLNIPSADFSFAIYPISQRSASFSRTQLPKAQRRSPGVRHRTFRA